MTILMPSLTKAPNGDHFARKAIPSDVRDAYAAAYGVKREALFRLNASASDGEAKRAYAEWLAEVEGRISRLRAAAAGTAVTYSRRELHELAGRWYLWFVARHETEPGTTEQWQHASDQMRELWEDARTGVGHPDEDDEQPISDRHRRRIRARLTELAELPSFLAVEGLAVSPEALNVLLDDVLPSEFGAALTRLMRLADGDFGPDQHGQRLARPAPQTSPAQKPSGWNAWDAFAAWVNERKPAPATVNRWRGVFEELNRHFQGKDVAAYTDEDAIAWKDALVAGNRGSRTINDIWLTAARTIFAWAVDQKKIASNPFRRVKVAAPKVRPTKSEFEDEAIQIILKASLAAQPSREGAKLKAARRWVPWLSAYTGSRPGEMTQLRREDVRKHKSGCWTLTITPEAGTVKGSMPRQVVLHEHLIEQGFIQFVETSTDGPLFYDRKTEGPDARPDDPLKPRRPAYVVLRNKLAEWVRGLGVTDKGYSPGHSWRHTFARRAGRAGIEDRLRDAICG